MSSSPLSELTSYILSSGDDTLELCWGDSEYHGKGGHYSLERLLRWKDYEDFGTDYCNFQDAVKKNTTITTIDISLGFNNNSYWSQGFWIFNTLYRHLPNVTTLWVSGGPEDLTLDDTMENAFDFVLRGTDRFKKIVIPSCQVSDYPSRFQWGWLKPQAKLQELAVDSFGWTSLNSMAAALAPLSSLNEVRITYCKLRAMEETDLVGPIDHVGANTASFQLSSTLRTLRLSDVFFGSHDEAFMEVFARGISESSIENLYLSYSCSPSTQSTCIAEGVVSCRSLRTLRVVQDEFRFPVLRLLRSHRDLTSLDLSRFLQVPDEDLEQLAIGMSQGTLAGSLAELSLSLFDPGQLCMMLAAVKESSCLAALTLHFIDLVPLDEEILQRIDALRGVPSLRHLIIRAECPGPPSLDPLKLKLERCLSQNFQMEHIDLCWLRGASHDRLNTICQLNKFGRKYLLAANPSKADGVNVLAKHCRLNYGDTYQLEFLFTHLRENPGLCSHDDHFANHSVGNASS